MKCFAGKNAIVTGGAAGIGRGLAEELARAGANVVIADINLEAAEATAEQMRSQGTRAVAMVCDVSKRESIEAVVERTRKDHGALDYMFNNAGIAMMGEVRDTSIEDLERVFDINLMGVIYGSKIAFNVMAEQGHGHIVNVSSVTGLYTFPIFAAYSSSKWAVLGFSNALRVEGKELGVRVSVICPQNIMSNMRQHGIKVHGVSDRDFFRKLPGSWMDANVAGKKMLAGVAKNRGIIIVPSHARMMWWLYRMSPSLIEAIGTGATKVFRRHRARLP